MAPAQRRKLPVWRTVKRAIVFPFANLGALIKLGLVPALLALAVSYVGVRALWPDDIQSTTPQDVLLSFEKWEIATLPSTIAYGIVLVIIAVGIHRLIIRDERPGWILLRFGRYELAYALLLLVLAGGYLTILFPLIFGGIFPSQLFRPGGFGGPEGVSAGLTLAALVIALLIFIPLTMWLNVRLVLTFPHAAVTGRFGFGVAWRAAKGNFWRLIGAFVLIFLVTLVIEIPSEYLLTAFAETLLASGAQSSPASGFDVMGRHWLLLEAFMLPIHGLTTGMFVALASYSYRELVEGNPAPHAADAPATSPA
jgi:hypothetical protein